MTSKSTVRINLSEISNQERINLRQRALDLFNEGCGYKRVATILNLSAYTVRDWLKEYEVGIFKPEGQKVGRPEKVLSKEFGDTITQEHRSGVSVNELSRKYGKTKSTIRYWLVGKRKKSNTNKGF